MSIQSQVQKAIYKQMDDGLATPQIPTNRAQRRAAERGKRGKAPKES